MVMFSPPCPTLQPRITRELQPAGAGAQRGVWAEGCDPGEQQAGCLTTKPCQAAAGVAKFETQAKTYKEVAAKSLTDDTLGCR